MSVKVYFFATLRDLAGERATSLVLGKDPLSVKEFREVLRRRYPQLGEHLDHALVAVNEEYTAGDTLIHDGDEVALFPPVSGGSDDSQRMGPPEYFELAEEPIDHDAIVNIITTPETGAIGLFSGMVRGQTRQEGHLPQTEYLEYEAYEPMALAKMKQVADEIREQYPKVLGIAIVQRIGRLQVGQNTILIACGTPHRGDGCFEAARYGIDRLKEIVPVWKKEVGTSGETWIEGSYRPTIKDRVRPLPRASTPTTLPPAQTAPTEKIRDIPKDMDERVASFAELNRLQFQNRDLLRRALTHRSFVNESEINFDNERLEFLGDAILDAVVAEMLFERYPDVSEGNLTQLRAALVRTDSLAVLGRKAHVGEYLRMGKGEENSGGRERASTLCRGYEALIGAIYLDGGFEAVNAFAMDDLIELLDYILANDLHKDARSMLQEQAQAELHVTPTYRTVETMGPEHEKEYQMQATIGGVPIAVGAGHSKRAAAQDAAREALRLLEEDGGWPEEAISAAERIVAERAERAALRAEKRAARAAELEAERNAQEKTPDGDAP